MIGLTFCGNAPIGRRLIDCHLSREGAWQSAATPQLRLSGANAEKSDLISLVQRKTASAAAASEFLLSRQLVSHSRLLIPPSLRPWQLPAADSPEEGVVPLVQEQLRKPGETSEV